MSTPRRTLTITCAFAVILVGAGAAAAYSLASASWSNRTVSYFVNPANSDVAPSAALAALQAGAQVWSAQSNADIQLVYGGATTATTHSMNNRNEVFFSNADGGGALAVTYTVFNSSGAMLDADIEFFDGDWRFFTGSTGCTGGFYIEDVAAHEFGHALGINHSSVSDATMAPSIPSCLNTRRDLHPDDVAGIEAKYPSRCDLDGSGTTVTDVQRSVNQAVGLAACTADINSDGRCDVLDVQRVVNAVLGLGCNTN